MDPIIIHKDHPDHQELVAALSEENLRAGVILTEQQLERWSSTGAFPWDAPPAQRYRELREDLLARRAEAPLSDDAEALYAQNLDDVWRAMSDDDRAAIEAEAAQR